MIASLPQLLASHGGFGLNLNLFETNIINLVIVIAGLIWFLRGFLGGILERRREAIVSELREAEERLSTANAALAEARKGVAEAQKRAEQIRIDGKARADAIRLDSEQRTIEELARMKQAATSDLANEASRVTDQLRRETALKAIEKALAALPGKLDADAQARLIDQSIQSLGNR
ncbi:MAG: F0F1 ATP synthase subunit B [Cyanobacteria bacterium K_Offshore_surface_m2_239]|nr:F0F1 ATP synthase subunit B [Cyanobacteria bacterium K_Offshore_surface_m2_239]